MQTFGGIFELERGVTFSQITLISTCATTIPTSLRNYALSSPVI
jgi:hypothetical protein